MNIYIVRTSRSSIDGQHAHVSSRLSSFPRESRDFSSEYIYSFVGGTFRSSALSRTSNLASCDCPFYYAVITVAKFPPE